METEFCKRLDAHLSGEMLPDEQSVFESHLAICSICREKRRQSQEIERLLFEQNASVFMRPAFQERVLASLERSQETALQPVERNLRHGTDRAIAINTVLLWSTGAAIVAAVMLWFALFIPKRSGEEIAPQQNSQGVDLATSQFGSMAPNTAIEEHPTAVVATPGYLCARIESEEPDVEFYLVRQVFHKN